MDSNTIGSSPSELNSRIVDQRISPLAVLHINMQSARCKEDNLLVLLDEFKFDFSIIMLTETWYRDDSDVINIAGYNSVYLNRKTRTGGGVCMYVKHEMRYEFLNEWYQCTDDIEILCLKVGNCVFVAVYRPPDGSINNFIQLLDNIFSFVNDNGYRLVLGGDLNIDMLGSTNKQKDLSALLDSHFLSNVIVTPTRITDSSATLIDLFITNFPSDSVLSGTICTAISDHLPIYFMVHQSRCTTRQAASAIYYRAVNLTSLSRFRDQIEQTQWDDLFSITCADLAYDYFIRTICSVYNKHFPLQVFKKPKRARKPWMTTEILKMMKEKDRLYHAFLVNRNPDALRMFKKCRNLIIKLQRQAKRNYYYTMFEGVTDVKQMWNKLHSIISPGRVRNSLELVVDNEVIKGKELADNFNEYFTSVSESSHQDSAFDYLPVPLKESIFLCPTDENEVLRVFRNFKMSKSEDINGLKMEPIKYIIDLISPCLTHIYNLSLRTGIFPQNMKNAKVTVIYKSGDKNILGNYRPISILPLFSKGLEKIIHLRLSNFLDKHSVITKSQYGFRSGFSTESALLFQKELILKNIEAKKFTLGIFLDMSKAFDRIIHETLLGKLQCYGVRGVALNLIQNYLANRHQCVSISRILSSMQPVKYGVPQGSILGPLLFVIFINDIVNVDPSAQYIMYADDTSLFFSGTEIHDLVNLANLTLDKICGWTLNNSLRINCSKTKAVLFRSKSPLYELTRSYNLMLNNNKIEFSSTAKSLGVMFHEYMKWDHHTELLQNKLCKVLGVLRKCQRILPVPQKLSIFKALFSSHLRYCNLIWGNGTQQSINNLAILQKKAIRSVANLPYNAHTSELFVKYNVIKLSVLYEYTLLLSFRSDIVKNRDYILSVANLQLNPSLRQNRHSEQWYVPRPRTNYGFQTLGYCLPKTLNKFKISYESVRTLSNTSVLSMLC